MNHWRNRFEIKERAESAGGFGREIRYYIVDKLDKERPNRAVNFSYYCYRKSAAVAASNIFRAEQRKIEKILLGTM